jgi:CubicO group peptidase (beta-lactamase class C family)
LVADGRLELDGPANDHLRTIRLADDHITVRDLLTQTDGLAAPGEAFAETVPDLATLTGPVLASGGTRGTAAGGLGGYAEFGCCAYAGAADRGPGRGYQGLGWRPRLAFETMAALPVGC